MNSSLLKSKNRIRNKQIDLEEADIIISLIYSNIHKYYFIIAVTN